FVDTNFYYPLALIRLLGRSESTVKQFVLITPGAQAVVAGETVQNPFGAMQWALARTARNEYPRMTFRSIDVLPEWELDGLDALARPGGWPIDVAVRGESVYAPKLVPAVLPRSEARIDPGGTYLITGGTRGLGLLACRWLKAHGARRFLLAARNV